MWTLFLARGQASAAGTKWLAHYVLAPSGFELPHLNIDWRYRLWFCNARRPSQTPKMDPPTTPQRDAPPAYQPNTGTSYVSAGVQCESVTSDQDPYYKHEKQPLGDKTNGESKPHPVTNTMRKYGADIRTLHLLTDGEVCIWHVVCSTTADEKRRLVTSIDVQGPSAYGRLSRL